jgi:hypothetical protein
MDEIRIYDHALTVEQIQHIFIRGRLARR